MVQRIVLAAVCSLALVATGCANPPINANRGVCIVAGAVAGGIAGAAIRNNRDTEADDNDLLAAGAIGAVPGAVAGALLCGAEEPKPTPPPTPAARPAPAPAPAPTPSRIVLRG